MLFCKQTAGSCFCEMTWIWFGFMTLSLIFGSKNILQLISKVIIFYVQPKGVQHLLAVMLMCHMHHGYSVTEKEGEILSPLYKSQLLNI
jgi:hypothetical protein